MEDHRGLSLRAVIGELASNIRATSPEGSKLGILLEVEPYLVSQDDAIAIAFLLTEIIELAIGINPAAQLRLSVRGGDKPGNRDLARQFARAGRGRRAQGRARQAICPGDGRACRANCARRCITIRWPGSYEIAVRSLGKD